MMSSRGLFLVSGFLLALVCLATSLTTKDIELTAIPALSGNLVLTVAFCPSFTTGKGALVNINTATGAFTVTQTFQWPAKINFNGCSGEFDDPAFALDPTSNTLYLDYVDDFGELVGLNLITGKTTEVKPSNNFFTGFENMMVVSPTMLMGFGATVKQDGFCKDGCFGFAQMTTAGKFNWLSILPYKALMDDSHYYDSATDTIYVQASYPLTPDAYCSKNPADLCLLAVNGKTGTFTKVFTNFTVYKWAPNSLNSGQRLAFIEGFNSVCKNPYDDFLFASINPTTGLATPLACMPKGTVDDEAPWVSSFSLDQTLFATASGNSESPGQLLILNTQTGKVVVNNSLKGLGEALKAKLGMFWVFSVDFIPAH